MITITIPRLLVAIAQAPFALSCDYDPEMALAALDGACQQFIDEMDKDAFAALVDAARPHHADLPNTDVAIRILRVAAIDGSAADFEAGGETPLAGITFAFEDEPEVTVKRWIRTGEVENPREGMPFDEIIEQAGNAMDRACTYEIMGEVLFEGSDGRYYVGTVEFSLGPANPAYVNVVLAQEDDNGE